MCLPTVVTPTPPYARKHQQSFTKVLRDMVIEVLQICRRCPKRKVRAWAAILQSQGQVQEPATSAKLSQKKINYFLPQSCMELTFFKVPCVKGMNPTSFLPWIRLNVLCWPEGVKLQPPAESHPHSQEPPQLLAECHRHPWLFLWKSRHSVKSCPMPSQGPVCSWWHLSQLCFLNLIFETNIVRQ